MTSTDKIITAFTKQGYGVSYSHATDDENLVECVVTDFYSTKDRCYVGVGKNPQEAFTAACAVFRMSFAL